MWGLEAQVAHIVNNMEEEVNTTVAEIELEMEIILLQHFDDSSKALDAAASKILKPTSSILEEYEQLLAELVPDIHPALAATTNLAADAVASDAQGVRDGTGGAAAGPGSRRGSRSMTVNRWEEAVTKLAATDPSSGGAGSTSTRSGGDFSEDGDVGGRSRSSFHTSPMTASLVALGALFAGVALAGGYTGDVNGDSRQSYESLL